VRAVYVSDGEQFVGGDAQDAGQAGRRRGTRPAHDARGELAERRTGRSTGAPLDETFGLLEEWDAERVPVVDGGRLVSVLSRSVLQRRLAEDEPPAELEPG
jgi:hypothetical protein